MSPLAHHIETVRRRHWLEQFLVATVFAIIFVAGVCIVALIIDRIIAISVPYPRLAVLMLLAVAMAAAALYAARRQLSAARAAALIDHRLELRERLSTAVQIGEANTDFSRAVLADAESCAASLSDHGIKEKFPVRPPRTLWTAAAIIALFLILWWLFPHLDLLHREAALAQQQQNQAAAKQILKDAAQKIDAQAKTFGSSGEIQQAKRDLEKEFSNPPKDPEQAKRDAAKALQHAAQAAKQQSAQAKITSQSQTNALRELVPPSKPTSSVEQMHKALANGDPKKANDALQKAMNESKNSTPQQRQAAAQQMQQMAKQLQQAAQNQQTQQSLTHQLQQMGFNSQQIQKLQNQTNPQAQKQMIGQMKPQMSASQQDQASRLMQQMSADANARKQMQAMSQSAQKMAQGMQQNNSQQMASGAKQMQNQLKQMQSQQDAAQKQSQQASSAQKSADQSMQSLSNTQGQPGDHQGPNQSNNGPPTAKTQSPGTSSSPQGGMGHEGVKQNDQQGAPQPAFSIRVQAPPPGQNIAGGKVLADFLAKGQPVTGQSQQQLQNVVTAAQQRAAEDADPETIDAGARQTVKEYFQAVQGK